MAVTHPTSPNGRKPSYTLEVGQRFKHLVLISDEFRIINRKREFRFRCDCGTVSWLFGYNVVRGRTTSCGCFKRGNFRVSERVHRPEYGIWIGMRDRCFNPKSTHYDLYGGRGITVCDRWNESFEAFYDDVGPRPSPKHSIDRYPNNDGNYEPGNVRWATKIEQANNKRNNNIVEHDGLRLSVTEWARRTGLKRDTIKIRIRNGWSAAEALTTPPLTPEESARKGNAMPRAKPMVCEVVALLLRDAGKRVLVWGDSEMFRAVAERIGIAYEGTRTATRILSALDDTPGELVKTVGYKGNRKVRAFAIA